MNDIIKTEANRLAYIINSASTWKDCEEEIRELCRLAGIEEEYDAADGDNFESVIYKAADILNVEI